MKLARYFGKAIRKNFESGFHFRVPLPNEPIYDDSLPVAPFDGQGHARYRYIGRVMKVTAQQLGLTVVVIHSLAC